MLEACFADLLKGLVFDDQVMDWIVEAFEPRRQEAVPTLDNLRNLFLRPTTEMLSFFQQVREMA